MRDFPTPCAIVDVAKMRANIGRMITHVHSLGARFRPHVKTAKSPRVTRAMLDAGANGITVSTLKEAEMFFAEGITDILYAVGMAGHKLPACLDLMRRGCDLTIITDNVESARTIAAFGAANDACFKVLIEIDTDGHRSGVPPESGDLIAVAEALAPNGRAVGAELRGVMTHAGGSYALNTPDALEAMAEQERSLSVRAAHRLREKGFACPVVSVGSTPTALAAANLDGVTEVRAGVFVFFDLVMCNVGVCRMDEIALSVLGTVIGHQKEKGWAVVDAGWMAMSRDRGTAAQQHDYGYGQVCDENGTVLPGFIIAPANQEHGIISHKDGPVPDIAEHFPIGTRVRILPNHACATSAQFPEMRALFPDGSVTVWPRFYGW